MEIQVLVGGNVEYCRKINMKKDDMVTDFSEKISKQKFKIPINVKYNKFYFSHDKKTPMCIDDFDDDEESEEISDSSSDSFEAVEEEEDEEDRIIDPVKSPSESGSFNSSDIQKKMLRKYGKNPEDDFFYSLSGTKKPKKELTEDEILKKNEQMLKRKMHAKRMIEEEKRQTIEKILNEEGRKLRERQKKMYEDIMKKEQQQEEKYKSSLTKIKYMYQKDGKIYVRFPQGLLLPQILLQKASNRNLGIQKCDVNGCSNMKRYKDPISKLNYCSVNCYKILKSCQMEITD